MHRHFMKQPNVCDRWQIVGVTVKRASLRNHASVLSLRSASSSSSSHPSHPPHLARYYEELLGMQLRLWGQFFETHAPYPEGQSGRRQRWRLSSIAFPRSIRSRVPP